MTTVVGLTGGIGAGKSTVAAALGSRGARVIDVDGLGRDVLAPGGRAEAAVVAHFGAAIVGADGAIDRAELAAVVFSGDGRLAELEAISHPAINAELANLVAEAAGDHASLLVLDMAVLVESQLGRTPDATLYERVIVVETDLAVRRNRLVGRGMTILDAEARMEAQATDDQRRQVADLIVPNSGTLHDLDHVIDTLWPTMQAWMTQTR